MSELALVIDSRELLIMYHDLGQTLTRIGCFHSRDEDILYRHLQEIFSADWLKVSPTIDKQNILTRLGSVSGLMSDSVTRRTVPVWETVVRREWKDEAEPVMSNRDRLWYGSAFQSMQIKLVNVLTESVHYRKLYTIRRPQRARILPAVQGYLMSIVWYYLNLRTQ